MSVFYVAAITTSILLVSVRPFLIEGPSPISHGVLGPERSAYEESLPQQHPAELWSEMTIIKTHYDCRGIPMWREVSKIKTRKGEPDEVVTTSKETIDLKKSSSTTSDAPMFFRSMRNRFKNGGTTTSSPPTTSTAAGNHGKPPLRVLELGPDRVIDTPIRSCPEGYNEDYNGKCRPVFPEPYMSEWRD